jgi:hypothetical protein
MKSNGASSQFVRRRVDLKKSEIADQTASARTSWRIHGGHLKRLT